MQGRMLGTATDTKMRDTIIAFRMLRILMHLSPFQKIFMYIVSFALILAGRHMGSFMFSIWQININTVTILANSVNGRGKEGLGQSICYI